MQCVEQKWNTITIINVCMGIRNNMNTNIVSDWCNCSETRIADG